MLMLQARPEKIQKDASSYLSPLLQWFIRNTALTCLVPFRHLPPCLSVSFAVNSFIDVLFILLLRMQVPKVGDAKSNCYKPKSHNGFVL